MSTWWYGFFVGVAASSAFYGLVIWWISRAVRLPW